MKNIVVLEKKELEILKGGETIRLMLPNGESIELGLDGPKKRGPRGPYAKTQEADQPNGRAKFTKTIQIIDWFNRKGNEWASAADLFPTAPFMFFKRGLLERKLSGKQVTGRDTYLYRLNKKGLNYGKN